MTHALLFIGYSLNDLNFRLLMESQLSTFGPGMPPRYALMPDVGENERAILKRNAGIEVLSYDTSKYGHRPVAALLGHIRDQSCDARVGHVRVAASPSRSRQTLRQAGRCRC